jgi:hypothetical protein
MRSPKSAPCFKYHLERLNTCLLEKILPFLSLNVKVKSTDMTFGRARHELPCRIIHEILKLRNPDFGQRRSQAIINTSILRVRA